MTTHIKSINAYSCNGSTQYVADCHFLGADKELWFNINANLPPHERCSSADAAIVALLIPSMYHGQDIVCEPPVSTLLSQSLLLRIQKLLSLGDSSLQLVNISLTSLSHKQQEETTCRRNALSFSGGVDACTSLIDYYLSPSTQPLDADFRVDTLLFNNVGNQDFLDDRGLSLAQERYNRLTRELDHCPNLDLFLVNSNLALFYALPGESGSFAGKLAHGLNHPIRNISVGLFLQNFLNTYLYSSTIDYEQLSVRYGGSAYIDPILLPMFNTESISFIPVGSEYTRVEKTIKVLDNPLTSSILDVCLAPPSTEYVNCGRCLKCLRTLACAEALGLLHCLERRFDVNSYREMSHEYWSQNVSSKQDVFAIELMNLAITRGFKPQEFFEFDARESAAFSPVNYPEKKLRSIARYFKSMSKKFSNKYRAMLKRTFK